MRISATDALSHSNMNRIVFIILFLLISAHSSAQNERANTDFRFYVATMVVYPDELKNACVPTACLIKLELDPAGQGLGVDISDSADSLFKIAFKKMFFKMDVRPYRRFLIDKYKLTGPATFLIPYTYADFDKKLPCVVQAVNWRQIQYYNRFDGITYSGPVILLPTIGTRGVGANH